LKRYWHCGGVTAPGKEQRGCEICPNAASSNSAGVLTADSEQAPVSAPRDADEARCVKADRSRVGNPACGALMHRARQEVTV